MSPAVSSPREPRTDPAVPPRKLGRRTVDGTLPRGCGVSQCLAPLSLPYLSVLLRIAADLFERIEMSSISDFMVVISLAGYAAPHDSVAKK